MAAGHRAKRGLSLRLSARWATLGRRRRSQPSIEITETGSDRLCNPATDHGHRRPATGEGADRVHPGDRSRPPATGHRKRRRSNTQIKGDGKRDPGRSQSERSGRRQGRAISPPPVSPCRSAQRSNGSRGRPETGGRWPWPVAGLPIITTWAGTVDPGAFGADALLRSIPFHRKLSPGRARASWACASS